ncbi:MAG: glycosyltransferase family 9 protein [Pirellulales bacterium]
MTVAANARVLLVRLSAIGDCLLTLPMACAIKAKYPHSQLTWVVERAAASLLEGHAAIDRLIVLPKQWYKSPREIWKLRQTLRASRFDVAFDPQSLTKSAAIAWLSGTARRYSLAHPYGRELALWLTPTLIETTHEHVVDRQLEMLHAIGIRWPQARFDLPINEPAQASVASWLDKSPCASGFVCINPGATWRSRLWEMDRFGKVAAQLGARHGVPSLVVWGSNDEREWAETIVRHSEGQAIAAPRTSLVELAAVLRRATFYLGGDTGPMHLAVAVGAPCVALYGSTRPENSGPYGAQHIVLQSYYQAGTSRQRRSADNDAMRAITVEKVVEACEQMLARDARSSAA